MKPKPKKPPAKKLAGKSHVRLLLIILALIIAAIACLMVIHSNHRSAEQQRQLAADKASFAQVEAEMAKAYEGMVGATGKPDVEYKDTGCGRTNLKFEEGALFCNIIYTFAYGEDNSETAYQSVKSLKSNNFSKIKFTDNSDKRVNSLLGTDNRQSNLSFDMGQFKGLSCDLHMSFSNPQNYEEFKTIDTKYFSMYQFRCSKGVISPVYSLAE